MFESHALNAKGIAEMNDFKMELANTIRNVSELMPDGREKSLFITKIEEAVFFGSKAIASKDGNFDSFTKF